MKRPPGSAEGIVIVLTGVATVAAAIMVISAAALAFGGPAVLMRLFVGAGVLLVIVGLAVSTVR